MKRLMPIWILLGLPMMLGMDCCEHPYYADADGDGFGDPGNVVYACNPPQGYVDNGDDCNDADMSVHPGALEICDGLDNDCDGAPVDEEPCSWGSALWGIATWY